MPPLSFARWLRTQRERPDHVGDLARDALRDLSWPTRARTLSILQKYLKNRNACDGAYDALRYAWRDYLRYQMHVECPAAEDTPVFWAVDEAVLRELRGQFPLENLDD